MANKLTTRQKLLTSAAKLFAQKGYKATSVRNIANDCGVNISMISYHFNSKEGLYKATIEAQLSEIESAINSIRENSLPPIERLKQYVNDVKNIITNNANFVSLIMMEFNNPSDIGTEITQEYFNQFYTFISDTIIEGINRGDFRNDISIEHIIFHFVGVLNFYNIIYRYIQLRKTVPISNKINDNYLDDAFLMILNGIKAKS